MSLAKLINVMVPISSLLRNVRFLPLFFPDSKKITSTWKLHQEPPATWRKKCHFFPSLETTKDMDINDAKLFCTDRYSKSETMIVQTTGCPPAVSNETVTIKLDKRFNCTAVTKKGKEKSFDEENNSWHRSKDFTAKKKGLPKLFWLWFFKHHSSNFIWRKS